MTAPSRASSGSRGQRASRLEVPLHHAGTPIGVLVVDWDRVVARVADVTAHLVRAYAEQASAALRYRTVHTTLTELAATDPLTGLANRRQFHTALEAAARDAARTGEPLSVAMFDLNDLKGFNDTCGHAAGDRLLADTAAAWQGRVRGRDELARLGGDEFALLLPTTSGDGAALVARELCEAMPPGPVTCSAGVATWDGAEPLDELLRVADQALYEAKRVGGATVRSRATIPAGDATG